MNDIIQLKITLKGTKPPIWRRILVDKSTSFFMLHHIIQTIMGWENYHLFEFKIGDYIIGDTEEEEDDFDDNIMDGTTVLLGSVIKDTKIKFKYKYDFGDNWEHIIKVEKFLLKDKKVKYPVCIGGELNSPPEDCGGVGGFYEMLETIKNKSHPQHEEMLEWLGEDYDAEHFDKELVNKNLKLLKR